MSERNDRTLLDDLAVGFAPLAPLTCGDGDPTPAVLVSASYRLAAAALRERRNHDAGAFDPWQSWRKVAARWLQLLGWRENDGYTHRALGADTAFPANSWTPPWDPSVYYENIGEASDAQEAQGEPT